MTRKNLYIIVGAVIALIIVILLIPKKNERYRILVVHSYEPYYAPYKDFNKRTIKSSRKKTSTLRFIPSM
jgi:uncharacterized membrane protein